LSPDLLVGAFGGYENFGYNSQSLAGRLSGEGATLGGYVGWKLLDKWRLDLGLAYSRIDYDGVAGAAAGSFGGDRWLGTVALIGTYQLSAFTIEPSARVFSLLEHENAYLDSLGTPQASRDFSTGRASGGTKVSTKWLAGDGLMLSPYLGFYGDYYFTADNAASSAAIVAATPEALLMGWSARVTTGITATGKGGASVSLGSELGGIGSGQFLDWSGRGRVSVPF
jgi:hypothetical protein